jgi:hypothetical protein
MVLPVLAALGITEAVWIAVTGLLTLVSWIVGIVFVSFAVRDTVTKISEGGEQASQDTTIQAILARTDITAAQKEELIKKYLNLQEKPWWESITGNMGAMVMIIAGILGTAYILGQRK